MMTKANKKNDELVKGGVNEVLVDVEVKETVEEVTKEETQETAEKVAEAQEDVKENVPEGQEEDPKEEKNPKELLDSSLEETKTKDSTKADLRSFRSAKSASEVRANPGVGVISIINSNNGKRISFSRVLFEKLGKPQTLQFAFGNKSIAVSTNLPNNENYFTVKPPRDRLPVIYSAALVEEITDELELDFTTKTSITFYNVEYLESDSEVVAIITL